MMFKKLFTITCNHNYFASGQCSDLQIEPTPISTLLKQYRLFFGQEDISVYSVLNQQSNNQVKPPLPSCIPYLLYFRNQQPVL